MSTKSTLRKQALQQRQDLSPAQREKVASDILQQVQEHLATGHTVKTVHIFLPIKAKAELDTWPIIHWLWEKDLRVAVPLLRGGVLTHSLLLKNVSLSSDPWGIPEPNEILPVAESKLDLVLVPLLLADREGNRLGYGKGHYDRFLAKLRPDSQKIGLSLLPLSASPLPAEPHDVPLDAVFAPSAKS